MQNMKNYLLLGKIEQLDDLITCYQNNSLLQSQISVYFLYRIHKWFKSIWRLSAQTTDLDVVNFQK